MYRIFSTIQTVARRTLQLRTSTESQIKGKLINCRNLSLCLDEATDINDIIFYIFNFICLINVI